MLQTPEENAWEMMREEASNKIITILEDLVITLPQRIRDAEAQGLEEFAVMVYGYEVVYHLTEDGWQAYFADTAD